MADSDAPFQALYRRYRPQTFTDVRGQDHVTQALQNAVRDDRVAHAYLFSGPRGTGKTSTARILAKALNCLNQQDGEPCGKCDSCIAVTSGSSFDVVELDAASNRGIDEVRDLIASASLVSSGQWRVFIVDEVHMLTGAAAAALLKTLEEPPAHVVFVLATTDPQKVSATIRSRTQHYEFRLLANETLSELLSDINAKAGLGVTASVLEQVVKRGRGSARDALSTLDQAAAGGEVSDDSIPVLKIVEAIADRDSSLVLQSVASALQAGGSPRLLGEELVGLLRDVLLIAVAPNSVDATEADRKTYASIAARFELPRVTRAIEAIGEALRDMRDAMDQRIPLEVALVKVSVPEADTTLAALNARVQRLEQGGAVSAAPMPAPTAITSMAIPSPTTTIPETTPSTPASGSPAAAGRAALGALKPNVPSSGGEAGTKRPINPKLVAAPTSEQEAPAPKATSEKSTSTKKAEAAIAATSGTRVFPTKDEITIAWGDSILDNLNQKAKARYRGGRWTAVEGETAVYALPNEPHRDRCAECIGDVEAALAAHFQRPIGVRLSVEQGTPTGAAARAAVASQDDSVDADDLMPMDSAKPSVVSPADRLLKAFPGAAEVEEQS